MIRLSSLSIYTIQQENGIPKLEDPLQGQGWVLDPTLTVGFGFGAGCGIGLGFGYGARRGLLMMRTVNTGIA
ncbi:hypothetical protein L1987_72757 [Smallanthus sonchifolius]|uniref:Uncharacterized protein n=1 Tax=Smallanthus sonchifolius TaxID=185202 RepID=A0ACB9AWH5_9ASTR|nr:hypothetical protein L1987_72757 [Smallanthus sonchifolius]